MKQNKNEWQDEPRFLFSPVYPVIARILKTGDKEYTVYAGSKNVYVEIASSGKRPPAFIYSRMEDGMVQSRDIQFLNEERDVLLEGARTAKGRALLDVLLDEELVQAELGIF